jgi:YVTN family beta-propeller protein
LVYVVNGGSNEVWIVNPERQTVVSKLGVGEAPIGIAITPDGSRIFVSNSRSSDLTVIDARSGSVLVSIPVGKAPFGVAVSPDGKRVFVVNTGAKSVSVLPVDLSSLQTNVIQVDKGCIDIKVLPDNYTVVVTSEQTDSLLIARAP